MFNFHPNRLAAVLLITLLQSPAIGAASFQPLFNGKDLSGWDGDPALWKVENGTIVGTCPGPDALQHNSFLIWRGGTVKDFELRATMRVLGDNNSGIQYRSRELPDVGRWIISGYQCDVHPAIEHTGMTYEEKGRGIFGLNGKNVLLDPDGERWLLSEHQPVKVDVSQWNEYTVIARGNHLIHKVNGRVTSEMTDHHPGRALEGLLAIQLHRGNPNRVEVKDVRLKPLTAGKVLPFQLPANATKIAKPRTSRPQGTGPVLPRSAKPQRIALWNNRAPNGDGTHESAETWITVHRPAKPNGTAAIICPGGGYGGLVTGAEGHGIATWLNRHGITGVVLEYRLPKGRPMVPLLDAQRALRTVRANARQWGIKPDRIGIIGFSAGGHLASTAGTHFDTGKPDARNPVERASSRPDFMILVYPVVTMGPGTHSGSRTRLLGQNPTPELMDRFSNEKQVTKHTPPAFLAHALDDRVVPPAHSADFHAALKANDVPTRYLELPDGGHGLNRYQGPRWDAWQKQSLAWLAELKLMPRR